MSKDNRDVPGNSMASAAQYQRQMMQASEQVMRFESLKARLDADGTWLLGMSVRFPGTAGADYLVVTRCEREGAKFVFFASSDSLLDAVRRAVAMLENGTAKWKEDQYGR